MMIWILKISILIRPQRVVFLNKLVTHFWTRWQREYLTELREFHRCKNRIPDKQIAHGEVVLIYEESLPRSRWRMGVVDKLYIGKDNFVRGCKLRTLSPKRKKVVFISRPIEKLYPLEIIAKAESADKTTNNCAVPPSTKTNIGYHQNVVPSVHDRPSNRPRRAAAERGIQRRILAQQH